MANTGNLLLILTGLPVFLLLYWLVPIKYQKITLIIGSFVYYILYSNFKLAEIIFLASSIIVNFFFHILITKADGFVKKLVLSFIVILNIVPLVLVKISDFSIIGISFYTFTIVALQVDIYKSNARVRWVDLCTYLSMFPRLAMGPITRFGQLKDAIKDLSEKRAVTLAGLSDGIETFIMGLGLKVLVADQLATIWTGIRVSGVNGITWQTAWLGAFVYTMELYLDFWGYSLIAIGLGKMIGLPLPKNFDKPYASKTVSEFWRRWHVTLGTWFRDYIYIPLGGNRVGLFRNIINLLAVWLLTALWHGVGYNFLAWGLILFFFVVLEKFTPMGKIKDTKVIGHLYILLIMPITWMVFAHTDFNEMLAYIKCMFGIYGQNATPAKGQFLRYLSDSWYLIAMGVVATLPIGENIYLKIKDRKWMTLVYLAIFWAAVYVMYTSVNTPFMYAAF